MASLASLLEEDALIRQVARYVEEYMSRFDPSHDFNHIERVVGLAHWLAADPTTTAPSSAEAANPPLDLRVLTLSALLHDVGDRKYLGPGEDAATAVQLLLQSLGAPPALACTVQTICTAVSWTGEQRDPARVAAVVALHPELALVQDADRLDAIGAVGIARVFTYGAARAARPLAASLDHFDEKLLCVVDHMKTEPGRRIARERTARLRLFKQWFLEEAAFAAQDLTSPPTN